MKKYKEMVIKSILYIMLKMDEMLDQCVFYTYSLWLK
jgi:hypothetical protein